MLGGSLSALAGRGPEDLAIEPLLARLREAPPAEVILALPATVEGAATSHYLVEKLKPLGIPVSRLAQGVPMGGALEVLDEGTLATALRARQVGLEEGRKWPLFVNKKQHKNFLEIGPYGNETSTGPN